MAAGELEDAAAAKATEAIELMRSVDAVGPRAAEIELNQLEGGWSRHTYALTVSDPDVGPAPAEYIIRVRPRDSLLDTDLGQEFQIYRLLETEPVPAPRVFCHEESLDTAFGGPFFVMERLAGKDTNVWRERDREELIGDWEGPRRVAEDFADTLAAIHAIPLEKMAGVAVARDLSETVALWRGIYEEARLVQDPVVEEAFAWVLDNEPDPVPPRLVHGDYRIGNCLIHGGRISGVLDWELSSVGDYRFDLGYMSLDYHAGRFVAPGGTLLGAVAETEWFDQRYREASGEAVNRSVTDVYAALGALMLFAIMGTGLRLYADGETTDIRMAWSRYVFPALRHDLVRLMGW